MSASGFVFICQNYFSREPQTETYTNNVYLRIYMRVCVFIFWSTAIGILYGRGNCATMDISKPVKRFASCLCCFCPFHLRLDCCVYFGWGATCWLFDDLGDPQLNLHSQSVWLKKNVVSISDFHASLGELELFPHTHTEQLISIRWERKSEGVTANMPPVYTSFRKSFFKAQHTKNTGIKLQFIY